jgi:hypothetical protein
MQTDQPIDNRPQRGKKGRELQQTINLKLPVADIQAIRDMGRGPNEFYREAGKEKLMALKALSSKE